MHFSVLDRLEKKNLYQLIAAAAVADLIILCIGWEWFLAPLRPGGSWLVLKALPLILVLPGIWQGKNYIMQCASMLILIYLAEALVRIAETGANRYFAILELILATTTFIALLLYLKPLKDAAKKKRRANPY
ncbi:DUF2069 domain-containing protein [Polynucleobacter sp. IMCC 29146]|uniref:DUF2069 domain-containing protein n=1 Tax=Polynucleobacter sp. IMCC 29146 TaxID=2780953 RepID=UPI001F2F4F6B|nr:DUF2069 domain-containing protein [Polynucleobacter sp. IMCC 29146]MCE7528808.1 DUF2069 domain-containing protein [Polynucleobacter sp. IMCC 29146]